VQAQIRMYNPTSVMEYRLASPSAYNSSYVMCVNCNNSFVCTYSYNNYYYGVAAIVSLKSGVILELENE
jgi:hypothetical protein